jgi:hypothetical protein
MNTIPLIFNERQIRRTIVGGTENISSVKIPMAAVLLNRNGSHYKQLNLENLLKAGFQQIICVENNKSNYSLEEYVQKFPSVKTIVPLEPVTPGDMINIAFSEVQSDYVLVLWDDIKISPNLISPNVITEVFGQGRYCTAPFMQSERLQFLPVQMIPYIEKDIFHVTPEQPKSDGAPTVYPYDYIGIYHREKFISLGGYDYTINNPFWQNLDLSVRAWLWGENINFCSNFKLQYDQVVPLEDSTADYTQLRFYLKNCAPVFSDGNVYIPHSLFFKYCHSAGKSIFYAFSEFTDARSWVKKNKPRFKKDIVNLVNNWGQVRVDN